MSRDINRVQMLPELYKVKQRQSKSNLSHFFGSSYFTFSPHLLSKASSEHNKYELIFLQGQAVESVEFSRFAGQGLCHPPAKPVKTEWNPRIVCDIM